MFLLWKKERKKLVWLTQNFRWALANPHLTLHIPAETRLTKSTQTKRNGMPRRPPLSLKSIISNIHLLTGVDSFSRWPLNLHFFAQEAHAAWTTWLKQSANPTRPALKVLTDYVVTDNTDTASGVHALPLDYSPIKDYVEKAHGVIDFERHGSCVHCQEDLQPDKGLYPICPNDECEATGHLKCWSEYALAAEEAATGTMIPQSCSCPSCGGPIRWGDMMKELTLRTRDSKEVERIIKRKKKGDKRQEHEMLE